MKLRELSNTGGAEAAEATQKSRNGQDTEWMRTRRIVEHWASGTREHDRMGRVVVRLKLVIVLHGPVRDGLEPEARSLTVAVARRAAVMIMTGLSSRTPSSGSKM
jgi:hypothetical protein